MVTEIAGQQWQVHCVISCFLKLRCDLGALFNESLDYKEW